MRRPSACVVHIERRVANEQAGVAVARHRREIGPVMNELGLDAEAVSRTALSQSATDVRELVSSAIRRIDSTGTRV